ncbi:hypothetical protein KKA47_06275, partial [bacterium]|nr:hypothetical protein [bacterium]
GFYKLARENQLLLKQKAYKIFLISQISGLIKRPFDKKYFTDIENCHSISFGLSVGDKLEVTNSLISSPGMICIIAPEKDVLDRQYVKIREIENRVFRKIVE